MSSDSDSAFDFKRFRFITAYLASIKLATKHVRSLLRPVRAARLDGPFQRTARTGVLSTRTCGPLRRAVRTDSVYRPLLCVNLESFSVKNGNKVKQLIMCRFLDKIDIFCRFCLLTILWIKRLAVSLRQLSFLLCVYRSCLTEVTGRVLANELITDSR